MDIDAIHKALANPVRREILQWLKEPEVHFAQQDHPLDIGVCAGLVTSRRVGQWIFFKRDEDTIAAFLAHMQHGL
jgi:DNA-binding transcriptional ArsR family regulator